MAMCIHTADVIEAAAGDPAAAEDRQREAYQTLRARAARGLLSTVAGTLADTLYAQGRLDEAQQ